MEQSNDSYLVHEIRDRLFIFSSMSDAMFLEHPLWSKDAAFRALVSDLNDTISDLQFYISNLEEN